MYGQQIKIGINVFTVKNKFTVKVLKNLNVFTVDMVRILCYVELPAIC